MRKLIDFWNKDIVNKLILLVIFLIFAIAASLVGVVFFTPAGKAALTGLFPTPTLSVGELFEVSRQTATARSASETAAVPPTITTMPMTPMVPTATPTAEPSRTPSPAPDTDALALTPSPTGAAPGGTAGTTTPEAAALLSSECVPGGQAETGRVLEVLDGVTVRVMIGELVYTVRYAGVSAPEDPAYAQVSQFTNGQLVYGQDIRLVRDGPDQDESSRLLRYALFGDTFVNLELVRQGLALAEDGTNKLRCAALLQSAEEEAQAAKAGLWQVAQP